MKEVSIPQRARLAPLFEGYKWNYLPDAILEGTMGRALADDAAEPKVAVLEAPRLKLSIPAGDPQHPRAQAYLDALRGPWALIFASPGWQELAARRHAGKLVTTQRFAFTGERLDAGHLRELGSRVPGGYRLERMDLALARKLAGERSEFSADHLLAFASPEEFVERGFGFCLLAGDQIVSSGSRSRSVSASDLGARRTGTISSPSTRLHYALSGRFVVEAVARICPVAQPNRWPGEIIRDKNGQY